MTAGTVASWVSIADFTAPDSGSDLDSSRQMSRNLSAVSAAASTKATGSACADSATAAKSSKVRFRHDLVDPSSSAIVSVWM